MPHVEPKPISAHAAIALTAAIFEKLLPAVDHLPEASAELRRGADALWRWQAAPRVSGRSTWTQRDARALPSGDLYFDNQDSLIDLVGRCDSDPAARAAIGAAIVSLTFAIWLIDANEREANPEKPQVLGNDLAEVSWEETLPQVLDSAIQGASDPAGMAHWLEGVIGRLAVEHPRSNDPRDFGQPVPRESFPDL